MNIAYLDCTSGISGDMMLGALVDAGADLDEIQQHLDSLGMPSCRLEREEVKRKGFRATKIHVRHEPEHAHRHLHHITEMIEGSSLAPDQKDLATRIFTRLGEAEAKVHGTTLRKVHFHEVGAVDSIADIVGAAAGWISLGIERLVCSPVPTGNGKIRIAHGLVAVPAPATAELLKGIPLAESDVQAELTTPTGAAILATLVDSFGPPPAMRIERIGYGAGDRDLQEQANVLRMLVGQTTGQSSHEFIWELETNLDDLTGELLAHCLEQALEQGALDAWLVPVQMKKNRPGVVLHLLCREVDLERLEALVFEETTTLGIRRRRVERAVLARETVEVSTPYGAIAGKSVSLASGTRRFTPEFAACREAARRHAVPVWIVYQEATRAFDLPRDS